MAFAIIPQSDSYILLDPCKDDIVSLSITTTLGKYDRPMIINTNHTDDAADNCGVSVGGTFFKYSNLFRLRFTIDPSVHCVDQSSQITLPSEIELNLQETAVRMMIANLAEFSENTTRIFNKRDLKPINFTFMVGVDSLTPKELWIYPGSEYQCAATVIYRQFLKRYTTVDGFDDAYLTIGFKLSREVVRKIVNGFRHYCDMMGEAFYFPTRHCKIPVKAALPEKPVANPNQSVKINFDRDATFEIRSNPVAFNDHTYAIVAYTDTEKFMLQLTWEEANKFRHTLAGMAFGLHPEVWMYRNPRSARSDVTAKSFDDTEGRIFCPYKKNGSIVLRLRRYPDSNNPSKCEEMFIRFSNLDTTEIGDVQMPKIDYKDFAAGKKSDEPSASCIFEPDRDYEIMLQLLEQERERDRRRSRERSRELEQELELELEL